MRERLVILFKNGKTLTVRLPEGLKVSKFMDELHRSINASGHVGFVHWPDPGFSLHMSEVAAFFRGDDPELKVG